MGPKLFFGVENTAIVLALDDPTKKLSCHLHATVVRFPVSLRTTVTLNHTHRNETMSHMFKTAAEALLAFKRDELNDFIPYDLPGQYRSMAAGGDGGPMWGCNDERGFPLKVRSLYPNKEDSFFQEVCIGMGWVDPTSEAELQDAVETLERLARYPETATQGQGKMEALSAWGDVIHSVDLWVDAITLDVALERCADLWLIAAMGGESLNPIDVAMVTRQNIRN